MLYDRLGQEIRNGAVLYLPMLGVILTAHVSDLGSPLAYVRYSTLENLSRMYIAEHIPADPGIVVRGTNYPSGQWLYGLEVLYVP
jgi:hypothetical protein